MTVEVFEWDDEKAAVNLRNHGVSFQELFHDQWGDRPTAKSTVKAKS